MPDLKIVLASQSKLLQEMLSRVFSRHEDFIILKEIKNPNLLAKFLDRKNVDWVLFSSLHDQRRQEWIAELIRAHPSVCFADIALDRNEVTFTWINNPDTEVFDLSLEEFIAILESGCICQPNQNNQ